MNTRVVLADIVLDQLCDAAVTDPDLAATVEVLRFWDRHARSDSRGYRLFLLLVHQALPVYAPFLCDSVLVPAVRPGGLPTGLVDVPAAVASLRAVVEALPATGLPLDAPLGDIAVLRDGEHVVPASGGPTYLGIFKCLELFPAAVPWEAFGADTWVARVRLTADWPRAEALLVCGNTTEPSAPVFQSQVDLHREDRLRPLPPFAGERRGAIVNRRRSARTRPDGSPGHRPGMAEASGKGRRVGTRTLMCDGSSSTSARDSLQQPDL